MYKINYDFDFSKILISLINHKLWITSLNFKLLEKLLIVIVIVFVFNLIKKNN